MRESDVVSAYVNRPQSIGYGQTISQPYIVALMTEVLDLGRADRVLEVGTGSGYQTAVLAEVVELAGDYSTERSARFVNGVVSGIAEEVRPSEADPA